MAELDIKQMLLSSGITFPSFKRSILAVVGRYACLEKSQLESS